MRTKIFCDIADYKTIIYYNNKSIVDGFTTNPSLMRLAGAKNYKDYSLKILNICKKKPISFEVFADNPKEMLEQAYQISTWGKNVYVKIPVVNSKGIFTGSVIKELSDKGISKKDKNWKKKKLGARFICVLTIFWPNGKFISKIGKIEGRISNLKRGKNGFGYDPIFIPKGKRLTFGEMDPHKKYSIDHRFNAFKKIKKFF